MDLLCDVFEETEDAPDPIPSVDCGGHLLGLHPSPADPRWAVEMWFCPDGKLGGVISVKRPVE